jgi:hypothetical protein
MEVSLHQQLIVITLGPEDVPCILSGHPELNFPVGTYKLFGLVPKNGKQLSEFLDWDYIETLSNKALKGDKQASLALIWLDAFSCHTYKGDHVPFERIGRTLTTDQRSKANKTRYRSQRDVFVNNMDRKRRPE